MVCLPCTCFVVLITSLTCTGCASCAIHCLQFEKVDSLQVYNLLFLSSVSCSIVLVLDALMDGVVADVYHLLITFDKNVTSQRQNLEVKYICVCVSE